LAHRDGQAGVGLNANDGRLVAAALVDGDFFGRVVQADGPFEECACRSMIALRTQQNINGRAGFVYGPIQVLPLAGDFNISFLHSPAPADRPLASTTHCGEHGQHLDRPPVNSRVIDCNATFSHHFLKLPQTERIGHVPAHARQDHFNRIVQPQENAAQRFVHRFLISSHRSRLSSSPYCDTTSDQRGEQAASDLLGHDNIKTTQRHYLRRGKIAEPTK
jgi:hypothetical protein